MCLCVFSIPEMNLLTTLFGDESFKAYLDEDPLPNVAVVGGLPTVRQVVADGVRVASGGQMRVRVQTFMTADQIFLKRAPRNSYEGHKAISVLKRNWCQKHVQRVFGCAVLLVDWDSVRTADKIAFEQHIWTLFEALRSHLRGSVNTRFVLALSTTALNSSDAPPAGGSYTTFEEAQVSLRSKLGLDVKSLVVVYREGVDEYSVQRLQRLIIDHCIKYHRDEIARIKRAKGDAHKSTNPAFLQARLRFKAAWHCLVLQDTKLMKHNLEKGYSALRQAGQSNSCAAPLDVRVATTLFVWQMIASNCNQLVVAADSKPDLVVEMLEVTVSTFLKHLSWVSLSYPSSFLATLDAEGLLLLQLVHHVYLAEWYEMLATKISKVLDAHHILPKKSSLSVCPGLHFQTAGKCWEQVRMIVTKLHRLTPQVINSQETAAVRVVAPPPTYLGMECRTSAVYYKWLLQHLNPATASTKAYDLMHEGLRFVAAVGIPRSTVRFLFAFAEHLYTTDDFAACFERLVHLVTLSRSSSAAGGSTDDIILCGTHKLMVQVCRRILKQRLQSTCINELTQESSGASGSASGSQDREALPKDESLEYAAQVQRHLVLSLMSLAGNTALDSAAQGVICNELRKTLNGTAASSCVELPSNGSGETPLFHVAAYFSHPFYEMSSLSRENCLSLRFATRCKLPMILSGVEVEVSRVVPVLTQSFSGNASSPTKYDVSDRQADIELRLNAKLAKYTVLVSPYPATSSIVNVPVTFMHDGLFEVSAVRFYWVPAQDNQPQELSGVGPHKVRVPFDNSFLFKRFETFVYDPSLAEATAQGTRYCKNPAMRHRPVARVVKPTAPLVLSVDQSLHAIEGEVYPLRVTISNRSSKETTLPSLRLLVPYLPSTVEVLKQDASKREQDLGYSLSDATDDVSLSPFVPDGYALCACDMTAAIPPGGSVKSTLYVHCKKGGKFELPLRLLYGVERCQQMSLPFLLSLHVCHPVFVTYRILGSQTSVVHHVSCTVPTESVEAQFIESSVLREIAVASADEEDGIVDGKTLGQMAKIDGDFINRPLGGGMTSLCNMLYTVERTQVPTDTRRVLRTCVFANNKPLFVTCKLSNSLQCPLIICGIELRHLNGDTMRIGDDSSDSGVVLLGEGVLRDVIPCVLGVDEDITVSFAMGCRSAAQQLPLGLMMLKLKRETPIGDELGEAAEFAFELPLPEVDTTGDTSVTMSVSYPSVVVAGEPFFAAVKLVNHAMRGQTVDLCVGAASDMISVGGRTKWTTSLSPQQEKTTTIKFLPQAAGRTTVPPLTAVSNNNVIVASAEDVRSVFVLPSTQAGVLSQLITYQ